jgi:hypothetical protein
MSESEKIESPTVDEDSGASDADIEAIIEKGEAGVGDLIAAYEPIERQYFNALQVGPESVTYTIDTNPR